MMYGPVPIGASSNSSSVIAAIAVGGLHTLALAADGAVWSFGCNDDGALGRGGAENAPGRVRGDLDVTPVTAIAAGDSHSLALTADGRDAAAYERTYLGALRGLRRALPADAAPRVVLVSSTGVLGGADGEVVTEATPLPTRLIVRQSSVSDG